MLDAIFMLINLDEIKLPSKKINVTAIECIYSASSVYDLYPPYLLSVAEQEGGDFDSKIKNTNGTYDLGYMQFNTAYIKTLSKYGISESDLTKDNCYPYYLAAWRIKNHIVNDSGSVLKKISNYHSRTEVYNERYKNSLAIRVKKWEKWHVENINNIKPIGSENNLARNNSSIANNKENKEQQNVVYVKNQIIENGSIYVQSSDFKKSYSFKSKNIDNGNNIKLKLSYQKPVR